MPERVLIYSRFPKAMMAPIAERYDLLDSKGRPIAEVFSPQELSEVRVLISAGATPLPTDVMDLLPSLEAIICYGTGYDGIDLAVASSRGIAVGHSPAANAAAVADLAVTLMLAVTRRLIPPMLTFAAAIGRRRNRRRRWRRVRATRGVASLSMAWVRSAGRSLRG